MKVYNAIGLQVTIIGLLLFGASLVAYYFEEYYMIYMTMLVVILLFAPSPFHEWRESEIKKNECDHK